MAMGSPLRTTMKNVLWSLYELNSIRANWNWFYKEDLLMIVLFYLNQLNMSQNLMRILIYSMLICIFHWKKDKIISCPFYMWKFFDNKVNLIQQFIENLPLAACIFILVVFLPMVCKLGMIYTQACRCFEVYSKWTKFYEELNFPEKAYF